ncbi:MAG: hypothetical protein ACI39F_00990 [Acutalibacteraceae bacterium]
MRADGKKLKKLDAMYKATPRFMPHRYDSMNMITIDIPLEPMREYVNKRRKTASPVSHLAIIIAAYIRVISQFPELNRFVVNKKFYARNEITVSMVVLKKGSSHGEMNKMYFEPDDTIDDVVYKLNKYIEENSDENGEGNKTDKALDILCKVPGLFAAGIPFLKWCDKHGLLPKKVIDASPFHASLLITNLSSIRTNHIYHHIYEFGTTGIGMAMGNYRFKTEVKGDEVNHIKTLPLGIVMDERVASGSFFATAFRQFEKFCKSPELLEIKPTEILADPNIKVKA